MTYIINEKTYSFELIENNNGLFDRSIDTTYVIHLEGNGRLESIKNQFKNYIPSKKIYILHNKGFKSGLKDDFITNTAQDLDDAYLTIFKHSQNNHFKNILILEDDFIFDKKINDKEITDDINQFIVKKTAKNENFMYYLGCIPNTIQEYNKNHFKCLNGWMTHSIIYSENFIKNVLEDSKLQEDIFTKYIGWDVFIEKYIKKNKDFKRYLYKDCLCYQAFTETENLKTCWFKEQEYNKIPILGEIIRKTAVDLELLKFKLLNTKDNPELYFNLVYLICKRI